MRIPAATTAALRRTAHLLVVGGGSSSSKFIARHWYQVDWLPGPAFQHFGWWHLQSTNFQVTLRVEPVPRREYQASDLNLSRHAMSVVDLDGGSGRAAPFIASSNTCEHVCGIRHRAANDGFPPIVAVHLRELDGCPCPGRNDAGEVHGRPADDGRQRSCRPCPADRVVLTPGPARSCRDALRARLERAAGLLILRQPRCRSGCDRNRHIDLVWRRKRTSSIGDLRSGVTHTGTTKPLNPQVGDRAGAKRGEVPRQPGLLDHHHKDRYREHQEKREHWATPAVIIGHFAQPGDLSMAPHREADAADAWPYIDCRHAAIVMSCSAWVTSLDSRYVEIRPLRPPSHCFSQMGRFERYRLPLQCGFRDHTRLGMIDEPLPAR